MTTEAGYRVAPLVVAGFSVSFVLVGGGIDTVGVFLNAIARTTDWSRSALSLGVGVGAVVAALSTPAVGMAVDRFGVRLPMLCGVVLLGLGFSVLLVMTEPWHFSGANVFLGAGFAACALLPITVAVTVCVPKRTALALGIVGAGSSAGALVLAPAMQAGIDAFGWRGTYAVLGAAIVLTPLPFLAFALPRGKLRRQAPGDAPPPSPLALGKELRRPGVASLAAVMILPAVASFSISVHLVPYLSAVGHGATGAAAALGATIGISAIGKVAGGFVADRFGALRTLRLALVLGTLAMVALLRAGGSSGLVAFIALHGLALGAQIAVVPAIALSLFGAERFGTLFGMMQLAAMLASAVGPVVSGIMFDATGNYGGANLMWVVAVGAAAGVSWWMPAVADGVAPRQAVA